MQPLLEFARRHRLAVIEDAAQSLGGRHDGAMAGTLGDMGCYSFFPSKNLGGFGDGGMVVTNNPDLAQRLRALRVHGARQKYVSEWVGLNSRLDALQAAILRAKLPFLSDWIEVRRSRASSYAAMFREALPGNRVFDATDFGNEEVPPGGLVLPVEQAPNFHSYNQYVIRVAASEREGLRQQLAEQGIETALYYPVPLNRLPVAKKLDEPGDDCPRADLASRESIALPFSAELEAGAQARVVAAIFDFLRAHPRPPVVHQRHETFEELRRLPRLSALRPFNRPGRRTVLSRQIALELHAVLAERSGRLLPGVPSVPRLWLQHGLLYDRRAVGGRDVQPFRAAWPRVSHALRNARTVVWPALRVGAVV